MLTTLLDPDTDKHEPIEKPVEKMRELCGVGHLIRKVQGVSPDHAAYVAAESNEGLIFYICGHIARKIVLKIKWDKWTNAVHSS